MSSWPRDRRRAPWDAGLTLVELMVASAVAMILIVAVYFIYSASARGYRVQTQMMGAMRQARFAMDQLQRDVSAAGFLATPLAVSDNNVCPKPAGGLRLPGIAFADAGDVAEPTSNVFLRPQEVTLFGAFWSPTIYFTRQVLGSVITLQGPADGAPFPGSKDEFDDIFRPKRFVRLVNADQMEMYLPIADASYDNRTITLEQAVPISSPPSFCGVQGFGVGLELNVVGYVRYRLATDTSPGADPGKVDLLREELDGTKEALDTVLPHRTLRVAEFVADLQFYDFVTDTDRTGRTPTTRAFPTLADVAASGIEALDLTTSARPQDLRYVTVRLTTRTQDEDESFPFVPLTGREKPLDSYEVDSQMTGSAHTVTLAVRVGLPSFLVRNVK